MKTSIFLLPIALLIMSCGNETPEKVVNREADSLQLLNDGKETRIVELDSNINSFIADFNSIQDNLDKIKEKEKIVTKMSTDPEIGKSKKEQIVADIQAIYDIMNENRARIDGMKKKLKNSNTANAELEKLITRLQADLEAKTAQITDLRTQMELLHIEMTNLQVTYNDAKVQSEEKTQKLNTAYYTMGTMKELIAKGILTKEGGFIGIGKTKKIKDTFNKEQFTKVDITTTSKIVLSAKKAKLMTVHPSSSYEIIGTEKTVENLTIKDAETFWSASKYLVIVVE
jgi:hypothetical protein